MKGVAKEELSLYKYVNQNGSGCFYNIDDEFIRGYYKNNKKNSFTYSYKYNSDVKGIMDGYDNNYRPKIVFNYNGKQYKTFVNTFGKHSYYNGLSAIAIGLYFGISAKDISNTLKSLVSISKKRMELEEYSGIKVINDTYNSNPNSVILGLETMKDFKASGKKHIVISDMLEMGNKSNTEHYKLGELITKMKFDYVYSYGEYSYNLFKGAKGLKNNFYFESKERFI